MKRGAILILFFIAFLASEATYTVINGEFSESKIYPLSTHKFSVYVPDTYNPVDSAALYVGLDGVLCNAPVVLDSLMSLGLLPTMIQVYLQPGIIRDTDGNVLRYNRSNEFDATDSRFVTFLADELMPYIEALQTPDGRSVVISKRPSQRVVFGLSSGGIAAFVAAWHRPDFFGKVFSGCGTFVPMRGGEQLQAIVRKHEPLQLRVFLQDGFSDTWNPLFGSWFDANRQLASALEFAGYDCNFDWAEGGHSVRRAAEIFPRVMVWMFRDSMHVEATSGTNNDFLKKHLLENETWTRLDISTDYEPSKKEAFYPDSTLVAYPAIGSNWLMQAIIDGSGVRVGEQRFYYLHSYDNSLLRVTDLAFDGDGNLWTLTDAGLQALDQNGRVRGILRLPQWFDAHEANIRIVDGAMLIRNKSVSYRRKMNIKAPIKGVRPPSQGQG